VVKADEDIRTHDVFDAARTTLRVGTTVPIAD
jgi:hypothetical protein